MTNFVLYFSKILCPDPTDQRWSGEWSFILSPSSSKSNSQEYSNIISIMIDICPQFQRPQIIKYYRITKLHKEISVCNWHRV